MDFDAQRAVAVPGEGVIARHPGLVCVARSRDQASLRHLLDLCAEAAGPDPGRMLARRLAGWLAGPDAPTDGLVFGTVAAAGDQVAVFLSGAAVVAVPEAGLRVSGADAAAWTDRLLDGPGSPIVLALDGAAVPPVPDAGVHDLRSGVVPGAAVVLMPPVPDVVPDRAAPAVAVPDVGAPAVGVADVSAPDAAGPTGDAAIDWFAASAPAPEPVVAPAEVVVAPVADAAVSVAAAPAPGLTAWVDLWDGTRTGKEKADPPGKAWPRDQGDRIDVDRIAAERDAAEQIAAEQIAAKRRVPRREAPDHGPAGHGAAERDDAGEVAARQGAAGRDDADAAGSDAAGQEHSAEASTDGPGVPGPPSADGSPDAADLDDGSRSINPGSPIEEKGVAAPVEVLTGRHTYVPRVEADGEPIGPQQAAAEPAPVGGPAPGPGAGERDAPGVPVAERTMPPARSISSPSTGAGGHPGPTGTLLDSRPSSGRRCAHGHPTEPGSVTCAVCGIPTGEGSGSRRSSGRLVFDDGAIYVVDTGFLVGRMPDTDPRVRSGALRSIVVEDPSGAVSRVHAEVRVDGRDVLVLDSGSRNGTFVAAPGEAGWTPLSSGRPWLLVPGTRVRMGGRMFVFETPH